MPRNSIILFSYIKPQLFLFIRSLFNDFSSDNIISIFKRKSGLGLRHVNEVCAFYNTDIKTLNMMASDDDVFNEIQDIDSQIDKMMASEDE